MRFLGFLDTFGTLSLATALTIQGLKLALETLISFITEVIGLTNKSSTCSISSCRVSPRHWRGDAFLEKVLAKNLELKTITINEPRGEVNFTFHALACIYSFV